MSTWLIAALGLAVTMLAVVLLVMWLHRRARRHAVAEGGSSAEPLATQRRHAWLSTQSAPERHLAGDSDQLVLVPVPIGVSTSDVVRPEPVPELQPGGGGFGGAGVSGSWDDDDAKRGIASDVSAGMCDAAPAHETRSDSGGSSEASYDSSSSDTSSSWDSGSSGSDFSSDP